MIILDDLLSYHSHLSSSITYLQRIFNRFVFWLITLLYGTAHLTTHVASEERNNGVHLAVSPRCGVLLPGSPPADLNVGIDIAKIRTIVSFGDSYTDGGNDNGTALEPPILVPPSVLAGGRSANGPVWVEGVANDAGATLMSYAQWGACIDLGIWPSNPRKVDFLGQIRTFLGQRHSLDPESTLYSLFFGINDYGDSKHDGDHLKEAANVLLEQIRILSEPPTKARSFLVLDLYGQGERTDSGEAFKKTVYDGLLELHYDLSVFRFAYVDFSTIWDGVFSSLPGYEAFGFTSVDQCTSCWEHCDKNGWCIDPDHHFYWIWGHPSKNTHRIMADFVLRVLEECRV